MTKSHLGTDLGHLEELTAHYVERSRAAATRAAYASDWHDFLGFCTVHGLDPLPAAPTTVAVYLTWLADAGRRPATLRRRLTTISRRHHESGLPNPTSSTLVRDTHAGIRRALGNRQEPHRALTPGELDLMCATCDSSPAGRRDRVVLTLGFAAALRRSELANLQLADIELDSQGALVRIRHSKADQERLGVDLLIPRLPVTGRCPVRALTEWLALLDADGPLLRPVDRHGHVLPRALSGAAINAIVQRRARRAQLRDASTISAHSLRAGLATAAHLAGVPDRQIQAQTRHRSLRSLAPYVQVHQRLGAAAAQTALASP